MLDPRVEDVLHVVRGADRRRSSGCRARAGRTPSAPGTSRRRRRRRSARRRAGRARRRRGASRSRPGVARCAAAIVVVVVLRARCRRARMTKLRGVPQLLVPDVVGGADRACPASPRPAGRRAPRTASPAGCGRSRPRSARRRRRGRGSRWPVRAWSRSTRWRYASSSTPAARRRRPRGASSARPSGSRAGPKRLDELVGEDPADRAASRRPRSCRRPPCRA